MNYTKTFLPKRSHEYLRAKIYGIWYDIIEFRDNGRFVYCSSKDGNFQVSGDSVELWEIL